MSLSTDRIVKTTVLRAPLDRVWRAISDSAEFGIWFGVDFAGPFVAGQTVMGRMRPTQVDPEVAKSQEAFSGMEFECRVERVEPMRAFAFRWHPYDVGSKPNPAAPTTLVTFELEAVSEGTMVRITESGFDAIPLAKRAKAFTDNEQGWIIQATLLEKFLNQRSS